MVCAVNNYCVIVIYTNIKVIQFDYLFVLMDIFYHINIKNNLYDFKWARYRWIWVNTVDLGFSFHRKKTPRAYTVSCKFFIRIYMLLLICLGEKKTKQKQKKKNET